MTRATHHDSMMTRSLVSARRGLILSGGAAALGWTVILCAALVREKTSPIEIVKFKNHLCRKTQTWEVTLPGLIVLGFSSGLSSPLTSVYITEVNTNYIHLRIKQRLFTVAGPSNKGVVSSMTNFNLCFGILLINILGSTFRSFLHRKLNCAYLNPHF